MRILHLVTRSEPGGAQSLVRTLAEAQRAAGNQVAIAHGPEGDGEAFRGMDDGIGRLQIPDLVRAVSPIREIKAIAEIAALYRKWKPDIAHLHTSKAGALGRLAAGFGPRGAIDPRRIVYTMHGYDQLRVENRKLLAADKALRARCGAVVAVSRLDADAMERDGYHVILIPNGVPDPATPRAEVSAAAVRRPGVVQRLQHLRSEGLPIAITVAREARPKRIDLARDIARLTAGRLQVVWIGGDPRPDDPPNFHALGAIPDAASYFSSADLFFLASDHEGMPLSVLEALAAGLPVVASAVGGIPEILQAAPGEPSCGRAVPNEAAPFVAALMEITGNSNSRKEMSDLSRRRWSERYSDLAMAGRYATLYHDLCDANFRQ